MRKTRSKLAASQQRLRENVDAAAKQIRDNADLQEARKHANHRSASDQSLLARALEAQSKVPVKSEEASQFKRNLDEIEKARRVLQADDESRELAKSLNELARSET